MFAWVVVELGAQVRVALGNLDELVLPLIRILVLERGQQLADALFKVDVLRQRDHLDVHVRGLLKLERTVPLEQQVVHTLDVDYKVEQEVPQLLKLFFHFVCQLKRVGNMSFRHKQKVVVAHRSFRHGNIEVL